MFITLHVEWWWWLSLLPLLYTTAPRTWIPGELVNAAMMNSLRDLFNAVEGGDALMKRVKFPILATGQSELLSTPGNATIAQFGGYFYTSMEGAWWVPLVSGTTVGPQDVFIHARGMRPLPGYPTPALVEAFMPSTAYSHVSCIPFRNASPNPGGYDGAYFELSLPRSWNVGNLGWSLYFFAGAGGAGNVEWYIQAAGFSDGESLNADSANLATITPAVAGAYVLCITPPISIVGPTSSAKNDVARWAIFRLGSSPNDTYASDVYLIGTKLTYITDAAID